MSTRWLVLVSLLTGLTACASGQSGLTTPGAPEIDPNATYGAALRVEAEDATSATPYLRAIDRAIERPHDPWAAATIVASLDALVWRSLDAMDGSLGQAIAYRSRSALTEIVGHLRRSYLRAAEVARSAQRSDEPSAAPIATGFIAEALHDLALRLGNADAAARWQRRTGCAVRASVAGPVAWPPLIGLEGPSPLPAEGALPAALAGVPPFAAEATFATVVADACELDVNATSMLRGVRVVVVDVHNDEPQWIYVTLRSSSAAEMTLGGKPLLKRPYAAGGRAVTRIAAARAGAGRHRLVVRLAQNREGGGLQVFVRGQDGAPLPLVAPLAGESASKQGPIDSVRALSVVPAGVPRDQEQLALAAGALLALGEARQAAPLLEGPAAPSPRDSDRIIDLLRVRAMRTARDIPATQLLTRVQAVVERLGERCEDCWEPRIMNAAIQRERRGRAVGTFAALEQLSVTAGSDQWTTDLGPMELAYVAILARRAELLDVARHAYEALDEKARGSLLLADVDAIVHHRTGAERVRAACAGGTSRAGSRCLRSHIARGDLRSSLAEIQRQRQLRGSPDVLQETELNQLLDHGHLDAALAVYHAMLPAKRSLAVLGSALTSSEPRGEPAAADPQRLAARRRFLRDRLQARDAPYAFQPLARMLGVAEDRSVDLAAAGKKLVAQDRKDAFLPGAGTAVLRHVEHYRLHESGLLHYWTYDLRRVSGTADVARGAWSSDPTIDGRSTRRTLRRRIHKRDGRVLDPDPKATGAQGHTELSQLEAGDYVEAISEGWALPDDSGQLVVDTSDLLPLRTSVREAEVSFIRPADQQLKLWTHRLLGKGESRRQGAELATVWRLRNQTPRRMEEGVPVMEARVGLSFGTDSWQRIARSIGERLRALDENDDFMKRWVQQAVGKDAQPQRKQIERIVAAVGKEVKKADPDALSDFVASLGGGAQRETARHILERARGSRSWVVHRALREIGMTSQIAISETRPFSASPSFPPRVGRFRHPLVVVNVAGKRLWIDADVDGPPLPPGRVSPELRGRSALLVTGEMLTVEGTEGSEPDEIDLRLTLDGAGDARGTFTALIHGRPAQRLAEAFEVVVGSARTTLLRNVVLGWVPWADVRDVKLSSDEGSWQVALRATIDIAGFARPEGRDGTTWALPGMQPVHAVFPRPRATTLGARYAAQAGRTSALAISEPLWFHVRRRIELPPGASVLKLAEALAVRSDHLGANRAVSQRGQTIVEDFRLNMPVGTVPLAGFEQFLADVRQVDDGFRYSTRVRTPAKGRHGR